MEVDLMRRRRNPQITMLVVHRPGAARAGGPSAADDQAA